MKRVMRLVVLVTVLVLGGCSSVNDVIPEQSAAPLPFDDGASDPTTPDNDGLGEQSEADEFADDDFAEDEFADDEFSEDEFDDADGEDADSEDDLDEGDDDEDPLASLDDSQDETDDGTTTTVLQPTPVDDPVGEAEAPQTEDTRPTVELGSPDPEDPAEGRIVDDFPVVSEECALTDSGRLEAEAVLENIQDVKRDFVIEFELIDPNGLRVADGFDVVTDVSAGQRFLARDRFKDVQGLEDDAAGWLCRVISVTSA